MYSFLPKPLYVWWMRVVRRRNVERPEEDDRRKGYDGNDTRKENKGGWADRRGGPPGV